MKISLDKIKRRGYVRRMKNGTAVYIGRQDFDDGGPAIALFNVNWPENELHGSSVVGETIVKLGITRLFDRKGRPLKYVPLPKENVICKDSLQCVSVCY